jgi:hypothetical protein
MNSEMPPQKTKKSWIEVLVLLIVSVIIALVYIKCKEDLELSGIAEKETAPRARGAAGLFLTSARALP